MARPDFSQIGPCFLDRVEQFAARSVQKVPLFGKVNGCVGKNMRVNSEKCSPIANEVRASWGTKECNIGMHLINELFKEDNAY